MRTVSDHSLSVMGAGPARDKLLQSATLQRRGSTMNPANANGSPKVRPPVNHWIVAPTVTLATFMEVLDTSIANVALPHIAGNLSVGRSQSTWVLTSYLVANAIVLPLSGWLIGMFGRKRFYMSCVFLFTISSAPAAAPSIELLIFFRVLQGIGGGGLHPPNKAFWWTPSRNNNSAWQWLSTASRSWSLRSWDPPWAAGLPTIILGVGFLYQRSHRLSFALSHQLRGPRSARH